MDCLKAIAWCEKCCHCSKIVIEPWPTQTIGHWLHLCHYRNITKYWDNFKDKCIMAGLVRITWTQYVGPIVYYTTPTGIISCPYLGRINPQRFLSTAIYRTQYQLYLLKQVNPYFCKDTSEPFTWIQSKLLKCFMYSSVPQTLQIINLQCIFKIWGSTPTFGWEHDSTHSPTTYNSLNTL